jgi:hypothetical protein
MIAMLTRIECILTVFAPNSSQDPPMTICPVAIVAGCRKCPVFKICPVKTVLGDAAKPTQPSKPATARKKK